MGFASRAGATILVGSRVDVQGVATQMLRIVNSLPPNRHAVCAGPRAGMSVLTFGLLWLLGAAGAPAVATDRDGAWSKPLRIPIYDDESTPPSLVADRNRRVHAVNGEPLSPHTRAMAIRYRNWSVEDGWSEPIDAVKSPVGILAREPEVYLDASDTLHVVFFGGNEQKGGVFHSRVAARDAGDREAWTWPSQLEAGARWAVPGGTPDGAVLVLYTGRRPDGHGLFEVHSLDGGGTWSTARAIASPQKTAGLMPHGTRFIADRAGQLHAVWSLVDDRGIDQRIEYARLDSERRAWSEPAVLARREGKDYKAAWPSIVEYSGELILVFMDGMPATRWMRRSRDGGRTWSDPERPFPHIGEYVFAELLIDGSDRLHIVLGNRMGECCHGMWHGRWDGDGWSELRPIVMGPKSPQFDPSMPSAVVSQGNVILVTWWTDTGGAPRNGAWFSYLLLDAQELPTIALASTSQPAGSAAAPLIVTAVVLFALLWFWRRSS